MVLDDQNYVVVPNASGGQAGSVALVPCVDSRLSIMFFLYEHVFATNPVDLVVHKRIILVLRLKQSVSQRN